MQLSVITKAAGERGRANSAAARRGKTAEQLDPWHVPHIDLMSTAEFEQMLTKKFGPEYLEPIPYRCTDGAWAPVTEEVERDWKTISVP